MSAGSIVVAYGYSGVVSPPFPKFPDGVDREKNFQMAAKTPAGMLKKWFGIQQGTEVTVVQAWTKKQLFDALKKAQSPIRQVHVFCHGDASRLSLAYGHPRREPQKTLWRSVEASVSSVLKKTSPPTHPPKAIHGDKQKMACSPCRPSEGVIAGGAGGFFM